MSNQRYHFCNFIVFYSDIHYSVMIIDAHIHIWHRDMIPDKAVENYLEPLKKISDLYDGVFDFKLDDEISNISSIMRTPPLL